MMHNFSVPPFDDPQIEQGRMELEAAASVDYGELPERRTTFDTPQATPILTWQGQVVAAKGSLVLFSGQSKSGKTTLLTGIAKAYLQGGGPVLGMPELIVNVPENNSVAWYDTEMEVDLYDKNMRFVCGATEAPDNFLTWQLRSNGIEETKDVVIKTIYHFRPAFVIIDGLSELVSGGVNDSAESTQVIRDLMNITDKLGICILCVVHDNEGSTGGLQKKARGHLGSELARKCTSAIVCEKNEAESAIVASVRQNRRGGIPRPICIRFDSQNRPYGDGVWEETGKPKKLSRVDETREKLIAEYAGRALPYSVVIEAIMQIEGCSESTAERRIKGLLDLGFEKASSGTYCIPLG